MTSVGVAVALKERRDGEEFNNARKVVFDTLVSASAKSVALPLWLRSVKMGTLPPTPAFLAAPRGVVRPLEFLTGVDAGPPISITNDSSSFSAIPERCYRKRS